jgi:hypothetical protein
MNVGLRSLLGFNNLVQYNYIIVECAYFYHSQQDSMKITYRSNP